MKLSPESRRLAVITIAAILGGCALVASNQFDDMFGPAKPQQRMTKVDSEQGELYHQQIQPLLEQRCVVCHGCYDAPCQLKLSSAEGIDRGASKVQIYDGTRLKAAPTSRLFFDYDSTAEWRQNGFYPVLNERVQTPTANQQAGVMARLLALKQQHPLPQGAILPDQFDFSLGREQQCPKPAELDDYEREFSDWGMPFGLPALTKGEDKTLQPGAEFDYNSANADVAGWLVTRVSGVPLHDFIQQKIWSRLGVEHDAMIAVDRAYMPIATGGMTSTVRDAALFGQMILNRGKVNGEQVVAADWIDQTLNISTKDTQKMRNNSKYQDNSWTAYKNMWWIIDAAQGEFAAVGVYGQVIYINRSANVVVAYFSSQEVASAARNPQFQSKLFAAQKIAQQLK